jgi:hypothetical protein
MYIFKSTNLIEFCHFCVVNNTKSFTLKIYILIVYIIDYVQNLLSYLFKIVNMIFDFFNNESTDAQELKAISGYLAAIICYSMRTTCLFISYSRKSVTQRK